MVSRAFLEANLDMRTKDDHGLALKFKHSGVGSRRGGLLPSCWHMSHCGSDGDHRQGVVVKEETVAEPEGYFLPHVSDAWTTILIPLVPTRTTHVPLSHTFTYDHHLPVPFLQLSVICVDTERHASCVKVAELGLAMSRARPWMYRHHRTVRTTDEDSHTIIYIFTSGPHRTSYLVTPSPPTS